MSYGEQFEKAVTEAGAVAIRIMRGPRGAERLIIQTPGGLITREVPLRGFGKEFEEDLLCNIVGHSGPGGETNGE